MDITKTRNNVAIDFERGPNADRHNEVCAFGEPVTVMYTYEYSTPSLMVIGFLAKAAIAAGSERLNEIVLPFGRVGEVKVRLIMVTYGVVSKRFGLGCIDGVTFGPVAGVCAASALIPREAFHRARDSSWASSWAYSFTDYNMYQHGFGVISFMSCTFFSPGRYPSLKVGFNSSSSFPCCSSLNTQ